MPASRPSIHRHPGVVFVAHGDLGVIIWSGEPTLEANRWVVARALAEQATGRHRSWVLLQIMAPSCGTPDAETRQYVQEAFKTHLTTVRRVIVVPAGDSFRQSVHRTIMRGMLILSGKSSQFTICSSVDEALRELGAVSTPDTPSRREVLAVVRSCFEQSGVTEPLPPL